MGELLSVYLEFLRKIKIHARIRYDLCNVHDFAVRAYVTA